jgi:RNA polymerase sigma factor (sigma-70 family)
MNDDATLLRRYAETGSNAAFTELVHRHTDLVYRAALRRTSGDTHRAADVAQQVFATVARDARQLAEHTALVAWLHTATRHAALNLMISDQRRQARELAAQSLAPAADPGAENLQWEQLRPVLDSAIDDLPEADRTAVILRFLEQRPFAEVGAALGVSEDAARVRTSRALEKLRSALSRHGITSTAAAIGALVSLQPLVSAPAGLAANLAARALASFGAATTATLLSMKFLTTAILTALVAFGAGALFGLNRDSDLPPPAEIPRNSKLIAALREENHALRAQVEQFNSRLAAPPPVAKPTPPSVAPGKSLGEQQRSMLNNLRQLAAGRDQFFIENRRYPRSADELVGFTRYIKRYLPVDGEDYRGVSMDPNQPMIVTSPNGITVTYHPNGSGTTQPILPPEVVVAEEIAKEVRRADARVDELGKKIIRHGIAAEAAYSAANSGHLSPNMEALIPYFTNPPQGADWVEFIEAVKAADAARAKK